MIYEAKNKLRGKPTIDRDIRVGTHVLTLRAEDDDEAKILAATLRRLALMREVDADAPAVICTGRTDSTKFVLSAINVRYLPETKKQRAAKSQTAGYGDVIREMGKERRAAKPVRFKQAYKTRETRSKR